MRLLEWFRRSPRQEEAPENRPQRWSWVGGRRILSFGAYIFPKDAAEGDRLDLQHHLIKLALGGNYRAPVRRPRMILDVACGTGIWGREMAQEFLAAQVIGFDIDSTPMEASQKRLGPSGKFPANFRFLEANALQRFPFEDGEYDFTHARLISPFVPVARWPDVIAEMVRVTRPGGYIEIMESELPTSSSPAFNALLNVSSQLLRKHGLYAGAAPHVIEHLQAAGLERIQQQRVILGTGRQSKRQQRLMIADFLAGGKNLKPLVLRAGVISEAEYDAFYAREQVELPQAGATWPFICTYAMKPLA